VILNSPVKPKDEQIIAGAMSTAVLENTPLVIDNTPVTIIQDSPYIFIVAKNGTVIRGKYRSLELYVKCFTSYYLFIFRFNRRVQDYIIVQGCFICNWVKPKI
jgi:hypothetical protein